MGFQWAFVGIGAGIVIVVVAASLRWGLVPSLIDDQVAEATQIVNGTDQYDRWARLPQALHFKVYFFEIQNPDAVHAGEEYPIVKEKGPYVYRQYKWKENIVFSDDGERASFDGYRKYEFDEEASGGLKETDEIHIINPVMNLIFQLVEMDDIQKHLLSVVDPIIARVFNGATNFFLKTTPKEVLFSGTEFCINPTGAVITFCNTVRSTPSENIIPTEDGLSFALFRHKETKSEGHYVINTGISDPALTHIIEEFNGDDKLNIWLHGTDENGEDVIPSTCNKLFGSDGNLFPPFPDEEQPLASLQTDICRVISVYYDGEDEYKGITGKVYRTGKDLVEEIGPIFDNECLCVNMTTGVNHTQDNGCLLKGAFDLFPCLHGSIVMTKPHMLDADEFFTSAIEGLEPDSEKHGTKMLIEPYTGTVLQGFKRIQLNTFLRPIYKIRLSANYKPVLMPILWIDEGIELNDKMITLLNEELYDTLEIINISVWVVIGVGIAMTVGFTLWSIYSCRKSSLSKTV